MAQSGYDQDRFVTAPSDVFECIICSLIVIEPYECHHCGKLYCKGCIADWGKKNGAQKCPNRCESTITPIFSKALQRMYLSLDIKCSNNKCKKAVKLIDLAKHEENCLKIKCWNYQACEQPQNDKLKFGQPCCSVLCSAVLDLVNNFGNNKKMYEILGQFCKSPVIINPINPINPTVSSGGSNWDPAKCGTGIELTEGNAMCFLKEQSYLFRTVLGVTGYTSGIHYWEIYADIRTENELKIGVATSKDFDFNSAFCDHPFGYAYYGLGQLRQNSNASGPSYGKRFKKEGVLGVCLNMNTGKVGFSLNGEYMGVAFTDSKLKEGPVYPAVALLHCAGCKIKTGLPVPSYFKD